VRVEIEWDGIFERLTLLPLGLDAGPLALAPDGRTVVFIATAGGQQNLYSYSLDPLAEEPRVAKQLTSTPGAKGIPTFSSDGREVYFLDRGRLAAVVLADNRTRTIDTTAELDVDFHRDKLEVFAQGWDALDRHFYDPDMHGVDWSAVRETFAPRIAGARTRSELGRLLNLMVGELNASHLGYSAPPGGPSANVGQLGLRFDPAAYENESLLRVSEVVPLSPADVAGIRAGEVLLAVAGVPVGAGMNLDRLLENRRDRRVELQVAAADAGDTSRGARASRVVVVRPISVGAERQLVYRAWVASRRAYVDSISGGRVGYVHMPDMGWPSLQRLMVDLDAENFERAGVVIDIRNNNGGFVNAYALDVFARRGYMTMEIRGYPAVPARSMLGQRSLDAPTALVINRNSLSDAEDFTEGYRTLDLGPVIGEPTAGWIIYTWGMRLVDGGNLRMPRSLIRGADGENMELNPRPVDVPVDAPLGEWYEGRDRQLEAAVAALRRQ
jgi:C-terminal processing protease CtpA/Prc